MDVNEEFKWLWNLKKIVCGGGGRVGLWFGTDVNERLDENGKRGGGGRVDVNKKVKFCEN